jgi:hypothetical protein
LYFKVWIERDIYYFLWSYYLFGRCYYLPLILAMSLDYLQIKILTKQPWWPYFSLFRSKYNWAHYMQKWGTWFNTGCIHHLKGPGMEMQYIVFGLTLRSILIWKFNFVPKFNIIFGYAIIKKKKLFRLSYTGSRKV